MAKSTMKVNTKMDEGFKTEVNCCSHQFVIDQPKASGGADEGANPLEVFLGSLGACICALGRIIAMQRNIQLRGINADIEGDIDKDFLLAKTQEGRAGFTEIRAFISIDADMSKEEKHQLIEEIESRCPVADNMKKNSTIISKLEE